MFAKKSAPKPADESARLLINSTVNAGDCALLETLLNTGKYSVNERDADGWTPLHYACHQGAFSMIRLLLKAEANPNLGTNDGTSPLHYLVRQPASDEMLDTLRDLLGSVGNVDAPNRFGETPLFSAILRANIRALEMLLEEGSDPNKTQRDGDTPLHYAVRKGSVDAVSMLLAYGADPNVVSKANTSSYDLAVRTKATNVLDLFAKFNVLKRGEDIVGQAVEAARDAEHRSLIEDLKTEVIREWRRSKFRGKPGSEGSSARSTGSGSTDPRISARARRAMETLPDGALAWSVSSEDGESATFDSLEGESDEESLEASEGPLTAESVWQDVSTGDIKAHIERIGTIGLGELLGRGAYGRVFKGLDLTTGQFVAVKEFIWMKLFYGFETVAMIEQQLSCLLQEIEMLKELDHPNIVRYLRWHKT
ncbi:MAG: ankyrin repeat domain-containing protein, partial [archaeon]|nr:ankyrin repeat domain-containing protein [archaeon]